MGQGQGRSGLGRRCTGPRSPLHCLYQPAGLGPPSRGRLGVLRLGMKIWRGEGRQGGNSGPGRRRPRGRVASPQRVPTGPSRGQGESWLPVGGNRRRGRRWPRVEATGAAHRARSSPRAQRSRSLESRLLRPEWLGPGISFLQEAGHLPLSLDLAVGSEQQRLPVTKSSAGSSGPGALKANSKQRGQPLSSDDLFLNQSDLFLT